MKDRETKRLRARAETKKCFGGECRDASPARWAGKAHERSLDRNFNEFQRGENF